MKKINSNGYGGAILAWALGIGWVAPGVLFGLNAIPPLCACALHVAGVALLVFLAALLAVELNQDRRQNRACQMLRASKRHLGGGIYECQSCGSRTVRSKDRCCQICGIHFND